MTSARELTEHYRRQLAEARRTRGRRTSRTGQRQGWTLTARVPEIIAPFVNEVPERSRHVISYSGLDSEAARVLLGALPPIALLDRQNDAPSLGALLRAVVTSPSVRAVDGYVVGPGRPDERVTATGLVVSGFTDFDECDWRWGCDGHECDCLELWFAVQQQLELDSLGPPSTVLPEDPDGWWIWWT